MNKTKILVTGATGYVGTRLVPLLLDSGHRVRVVGRSLTRIQKRSWANHNCLELVEMDIFDRGLLRRACEGCEVAYYLIHSMKPSQRDFSRADREAAGNMVWAAEHVGIKRIIYLGGLGEDMPNLSKHLRSRAEVAEILRDSSVSVTTFRAAMIMGSGSASFEILRYLVERLPAMVTPKWVHTKTQPISIRDVLSYLVNCLDNPASIGQSFDIGGPDILTYREIMDIYAEEAKLSKRLIFPVPVLTPRLSSYWIHFITPIHASLARPLAEGLRNEAICQEERIKTLIPLMLHDVRTTIQKALSPTQHLSIKKSPEEIRKQPPEWMQPGDPKWAGGTIFRDRRCIRLRANLDDSWLPVVQIGGKNGWYYANWLWNLRGWIDQFISGVGMGRGRTDPNKLCIGDVVDCWRVNAIESKIHLILEAEMKLPGQAFLEFHMAPIDKEVTEIEQIASFHPHGLLGILYWFTVLPAHNFIFHGMLKGIVARTGKNALEVPILTSKQPKFRVNFFQLQKKIRLPISVDEAWNFFSNPHNLMEITPPNLNLVVDNKVPSKMRPGMIITYRIKPLLGIPINWITEITHVEEGHFFVDEQRFGPYRFWHHQHQFHKVPGGVEICDVVHYMLPLGPFSFFANRFIVRQKLHYIFSFRKDVLEKKFGQID